MLAFVCCTVNVSNCFTLKVKTRNSNKLFFFSYLKKISNNHSVQHSSFFFLHRTIIVYSSHFYLSFNVYKHSGNSAAISEIIWILKCTWPKIRHNSYSDSFKWCPKLRWSLVGCELLTCFLVVTFPAETPCTASNIAQWWQNCRSWKGYFIWTYQHVPILFICFF